MLNLPLSVLVALLAQAGAAESRAPTASADGGLQPEAIIELIVEDLKGRPVRDLRGSEVILKQDGQPEMVSGLSFRDSDAVYELRYRPTRGRLGAVLIRLLRPGTKLRGPTGAFVTARWADVVQEYEKPLLAALGEPGEAHDIECDIAVLRFEDTTEGVHHTVVFDIPPRQLRCTASEGRRSCRVAMMARVLTPAGRLVGRQSVERDLGVPGSPRRGMGASESALDGWAAWTGHFHLVPGRYVLETVLLNGAPGRRTLRRTPLDVAAPAKGLRMSSVVALRGADNLMQSEDVADNPLRFANRALIPTVRGQFVAGSLGHASFYVVLYPNRSNPQPVTCMFEGYRDGALIGRQPLQLPPPSPTGEIGYFGGLDLRTLKAAQYDVKLVATQGVESVEETLALVLQPPPQVQ